MASKLNLETITATIKAQEHEELVQRIAQLKARVQSQDSNGRHSGRRF